MNPLVLVDGDTIGRARTGDETYTVELLRALPAAAPQLRLACSLRDPAAMPAGVPASVQRVRLAVASPLRRIPVSFPRLARRLGAALAHVHYFVAPTLRCPAVVTVHDLSFLRRPELFSRRDRLLLGRGVPPSLRGARRVIAPSQFTRIDLIEAYGIDPARVVAIPNGVGASFRPIADAGEMVRKRHGLDPGYVLFVGALQPRKNATTLIDAFAALGDAGAARDLVLAGRDRGGLGAVRERIARHGLERRVHVLGHVPDDDLVAVYGAARVLCMPSLYEGFGLPVLEAMACGTPVVASATTALAEAVGDAGLKVEPQSVAAIVAALTRVLGDDEVHARLRSAGLRRAGEFTWERAAHATAGVYRAALG